MAGLQAHLHAPEESTAAGGVVVGGNNYGAINTGVIVNIQGDDIDRNLGVARVVADAMRLAPAVDPRRKEDISALFLAVAQTLGEAAEILRQGAIPYGKCGEMLGYAQQLPAAIGDVVGQEQAAALGRKLEESHRVEGFGHQFMHLPPAERDAKFGLLDEAAGYFRAAAGLLKVRR